MADKPKHYITWDQVQDYVLRLVDQIHFSGRKIEAIVAVSRGGDIPALLLARALKISNVRFVRCASYEGERKIREPEILIDPRDHLFNFNRPEVLFIDDLIDSGGTTFALHKRWPNASKAVLLDKELNAGASLYTNYIGESTLSSHWVVFPWETLDLVVGEELAGEPIVGRGASSPVEASSEGWTRYGISTGRWSAKGPSFDMIPKERSDYLVPYADESMESPFKMGLGGHQKNQVIALIVEVLQMNGIKPQTKARGPGETNDPARTYGHSVRSD